jgi:DNA polymerase
MIVGEAPGVEEDLKKQSFVGRSGEAIWSLFDTVGYKRSDFYITNIVKCYPSKTRTPSNKHIKKCSKWISEEIKKVKPLLILGFGNTSLKYFFKIDKGIINRSGKISWSVVSKCWVMQCIHPASTFYQEDNKILFNKTILSFIEKIKKLGR